MHSRKVDDFLRNQNYREHGALNQLLKKNSQILRKRNIMFTNWTLSEFVKDRRMNIIFSFFLLALVSFSQLFPFLLTIQKR